MVECVLQMLKRQSKLQDGVVDVLTFGELCIACWSGEGNTSQGGGEQRSDGKHDGFG